MEVVNIPGSKVSEGQVINEYVGSAPPNGTDLHRYVFLLYRQPKKFTFDEPYHGDTDAQRGTFLAEAFAKKIQFGEACCWKFFPLPI
ncbi:hypothetical protein NQ314_013092 [Rhamnusium bicolor]|uniref:Uncharacterized protein n=1 Tax=Rhamnusium bicolor TaxID=1586634 RepID=A0AAV8X7N6_9CUCU|nr:hypothetical protein NQ314_013092 [Rhamnusium bicolor]